MKKDIDIFELLDNYIELKNKWKYVLGFIAFVGLLTAFTVSAEDNEKRLDIIKRWEEQLPDNHWVKEEIGLGDFVTFQLEIKSFIRLMQEDFTTTLGEEGEAGEFMAMILEGQDKLRRSKYILRFQDTEKKVKKIKIKEGEHINLSFYKGEEQLVFDITQDDYYHMKNELVLSSVENTEIATISNGTITGNKKGKTTLYILCDGYYWEYTIKVK